MLPKLWLQKYITYSCYVNYIKIISILTNYFRCTWNIHVLKFKAVLKLPMETLNENLNVASGLSNDKSLEEELLSRKAENGVAVGWQLWENTWYLQPALHKVQNHLAEKVSPYLNENKINLIKETSWIGHSIVKLLHTITSENVHNVWRIINHGKYVLHI